MLDNHLCAFSSILASLRLMVITRGEGGGGGMGISSFPSGDEMNIFQALFHLLSLERKLFLPFGVFCTPESAHV